MDLFFLVSKERVPIPVEVRRKLFVTCGHRCSVPFCKEKNNLIIHHINSDPSDNREENLIVLCRNHHAMADKGEIDRKECIEYKNRLKIMYKKDEEILSLKEQVNIEGIDVEADPLFVRFILNFGRNYMMNKYGKPDSSMKNEIIALVLLTMISFTPLLYGTFILKEHTNTTFLYIEIGSALIGVLLLSILSVVFNRRCKKCKGYFGIEVIDSKLVDEKEIYRTETKINMRKIYRNTYRCAICGNQYSKNVPEEITINITPEE